MSTPGGRPQTPLMTVAQWLAGARPAGEKAPQPIPRIAHWIWLGSPLPRDFAANINRFVSLNPDYTPTLWVDKQAWTIKHHLALENLSKKVEIHLIDEALAGQDVKIVSAFSRERCGPLKNLAAASDIARIVVLHLQGGLYMDADASCATKLDHLQFHSGIGRSPRCNDLIAAPQAHEHLARALREIADGYHTPAPSAHDSDVDRVWRIKRSFNSRERYLPLAAQANRSYGLEGHERLRERLAIMVAKDTAAGLGHPGVFTQIPRLAHTMDLTGPMLWHRLAADTASARLAGYFEETDRSGRSFIDRPGNLRRASTSEAPD